MLVTVCILVYFKFCPSSLEENCNDLLVVKLTRHLNGECGSIIAWKPDVTGMVGPGKSSVIISYILRSLLLPGLL